MRFKFGYTAPSNKRQYWFSCGAKDIEILHGLVSNACQHAPSLDKDTNPEYADIYNRLRSMRQDLGKGMKEAAKLGDDGERVHNEQNTDAERPAS